MPNTNTTNTAKKKLVEVTPQLLDEKIKAAAKEKKNLEAQAKALLAQDKGDSPEYDSLLNKHRQLRGHQRMLEGMKSNQEAKAEDENIRKNQDLAEHGSQVLDNLKRQMEDDDRRR